MDEGLPGDAMQQPRRLTVAVGVVIIIALTLLLVAGTAAVLFELAPDEGGPPEVAWQIDPGDPPVLTHGGGDPVDCERVLLGGELGDGESLCTYVDEPVITEGDTVLLTGFEGRSGTIVIQWKDVETGQVVDLTEPFHLE